MANLVSLLAFTFDGNGCQPDYKMLKITSKQKSISLITRGWNNILSVDSDLRLRTIEFSIAPLSWPCPVFVAQALRRRTKPQRLFGWL